MVSTTAPLGRSWPTPGVSQGFMYPPPGRSWPPSKNTEKRCTVALLGASGGSQATLGGGLWRPVGSPGAPPGALLGKPFGRRLELFLGPSRGGLKMIENRCNKQPKSVAGAAFFSVFEGLEASPKGGSGGVLAGPLGSFWEPPWGPPGALLAGSWGIPWGPPGALRVAL